MPPEFLDREPPSPAEHVQAALVHLLVVGTAAGLGPGVLAWILFERPVGADIFLLFFLVIGTYFPLVTLMDRVVKQRSSMGLLAVGVPVTLQVVSSLLMAVFVLPVLFFIALPAWGLGLLTYGLLGQNILLALLVGLGYNVIRLYLVKQRERQNPDIESSSFVVRVSEGNFSSLYNQIQALSESDDDDASPDVIQGEATRTVDALPEDDDDEAADAGKDQANRTL